MDDTVYIPEKPYWHFFWSIMGKPRNVPKKWPYAYLGSYLMRIEALTRNKPLFFQHVVGKKRARMLEKYRIGKNP